MLKVKIENAVVELPTTTAERREAAEREQLRRAAERSKFIAAQSSPKYEPRVRIRLWEQLHAMHLPREPNHRLVRVIARHTALSVEQIRAEQTRRSEETSAPPIPETGA